jgi:thiamine-phosphate pyrophosphorylase
VTRRLPAPLLVVTDRRQAAAPLEQVAQAAFAGGCRWLSLREKDLPPDALSALARAVAAPGHAAGAVVTLHGRAEAAAAAGLDGVHLPAGGDAAAARALLGPGALLGRSVHATAEAAQAADVDYVIIGPVFPTASKPGYGPALGLDGLAAAARACPVPVVAIGGIDAGNAAACLAAGAAAVAVMGGVMRAADPAAAVATLLAAIRSATAGSCPPA